MGTGAEGSSNWASTRPNLLDGPLTRTVKRLVVIGDHDLWSWMDGFGALARDKKLERCPSRHTLDSFAR